MKYRETPLLQVVQKICGKEVAESRGLEMSVHLVCTTFFLPHYDATSFKVTSGVTGGVL